LRPGDLSGAFRAGDSFYVVRMKDAVPSRRQDFSEVKAKVAEILRPRKEKEWFDANAEKSLFTLKGQRFSVKQFYKEYQELPVSLQQDYSGPEGLTRLADALIDRMLLIEDTYDKLDDLKTKPLSDERRL